MRILKQILVEPPMLRDSGCYYAHWLSLAMFCQQGNSVSSLMRFPWSCNEKAYSIDNNEALCQMLFCDLEGAGQFVSQSLDGKPNYSQS